MGTKLKIRTLDSRIPTPEFKNIPRAPITVILDNLRSAFNVGSIIRTSDCALVKKVIMCGITAHPPHKKLHKTAVGTLDYVDCEYEPFLIDAVKKQKRQGIPVVALETTNKSKIIWDFKFPFPVSIILGNEALGISRNILEWVDDIIEIPMLGLKNSINVAVAYGIVVSEIQRQNWKIYPRKTCLTK
ncbi:MAG: RNA methyltransferase [bacterium]